MTTDYIPEEMFQKLLDCLMPENALVLRLMMDTGMRISDALSIRKNALFGAAKAGTMYEYTYTEQKTGKERIARIPPDLAEDLQRLTAPSVWLFPGRDPSHHRTRQAVWKDLHRTAKLWRVNGQKLRRNLGTHSARKIYAVKLYHEQEELGLYDPLHYVQVDMNHKDMAVTFLYAMADVISDRRRQKKAS